MTYLIKLIISLSLSYTIKVINYFFRFGKQSFIEKNKINK
jgi:hypothetical protein